MARSRQPEPQFPVKLSQAQRKVVAEIAPKLVKRLQLDARGQRTVSFSRAELQTVKKKAESALQQAGTARSRIPLQYVFEACGQALDQHPGTTAPPEVNQHLGTTTPPQVDQFPGTPKPPEVTMTDWFLAELRAIAGGYQWQYVAPDRKAQVQQIAYRIWQQQGRPKGQEQAHWWQAEKEFHADKPIRGAILGDPARGPDSQLLGPLQAVIHAKTGAVHPASAIAELAAVGVPVTPGEVGAIEAAADAAATGYSAALRTDIAKAVGLEK